MPRCTCCSFRSVARRINSFQPLKGLQSVNTRSLLALQLVCMTCVVPSFKEDRPYSHRQMTYNDARCITPPFFFNELLHVKIDFFPSLSTFSLNEHGLEPIIYACVTRFVVSLTSYASLEVFRERTLNVNEHLKSPASLAL